MRMKTQWIAKVSVVLTLALGACSEAPPAGRFQVDNLPDTQATQTIATERLDADLREQVLQAVNQRSWQEIERIISVQPDSNKTYDILFVALEEIGKIQSDEEARELFDQAVNYNFSSSDYVDILGELYDRFRETDYAEEEKLEQALTIAENNVGKADPNAIASELRNVLSQVTDPLEISQYVILTYTIRTSGLGDGEMADAQINRDEYVDSMFITLKRIITLAIQLDAPDIADIAFNSFLQSAKETSYLYEMNRAVNEVAKTYPTSEIPKPLQVRLSEALAQ